MLILGQLEAKLTGCRRRSLTGQETDANRCSPSKEVSMVIVEDVNKRGKRTVNVSLLPNQDPASIWDKTF